MLREIKKNPNAIYIDNTMASSFNSCPRKFYWRHVLHLVNKGGTPAALEYGKAIHFALETLYKGGTLEDTLHAFLKDFNPDDGDAKRNVENGLITLEGYYNKWIPEHFVIKEVEVAGSIELSNDCLFAYRMDLLVEYLGGVYICEHKTTGNMRWLVPKPNHQISGYVYAGKTLGFDMDGAIINLLGVYSVNSKIKMDDRFQRNITTRTAEDLEEWRHYILTTKASIDSCVEQRWFPQYTHSCWNCTYQDLCNSSPKALEQVIDFSYNTERWEPWKSD